MPVLRAAAGSVLVLGTLLLGACGRGGAGGEGATPESLADTPRVPPEQETFYTDVPVEGFDALSPGAQADVAARANRARCDCGCFGHSVNACLHMKETCDVAVRLATRFVAEARLAAEIAEGSATGSAAQPGPDAAPAEDPDADAAPAGGADAAPDAPAASDPESGGAAPEIPVGSVDSSGAPGDGAAAPVTASAPSAAPAPGTASAPADAPAPATASASAPAGAAP